MHTVYKQALDILDKKSYNYHHCTIIQKYGLFTLDDFGGFSHLRSNHCKSVCLEMSNYSHVLPLSIAAKESNRMLYK